MGLEMQWILYGAGAIGLIWLALYFGLKLAFPKR
jgi:hypothetical protein